MGGRAFLTLRVRIWIAGSLLLLVLSLVRATPPYAPLNAETLTPAPGFSVEIPLIGRVFEPFVGLPSYFASLHHPLTQGYSWGLWTLLIVSIRRVVGSGRISFRRVIRDAAYVVGAMGLSALYILFMPLPPVTLIPQDHDTVLLDIHSHTYYSHDGLASPGENIAWHLDHNFSSWFVTDHWNLGSSEKLRERVRQMPSPPTILPGEEVSDDIGNYLLVLGGRESFANDRWLPAGKIVERAHSTGGIVVSSLWWRQPTALKDLATAGVDGFEVYNAGHPTISARKRQEFVAMAAASHLPLFASPDWHGWGSFCWTWNALRIPGWGTMTLEQRKMSIMEAIRGRDSGILPLLYGRQEVQGIGRIIFSPFVCGFYYFTSLDIFGTLSWIGWSFIVIAFGRSRFGKRCAFAAVGLGGIFLVIRGASYLVSSSHAPSTIIAPTGAGLVLLGGLLLYSAMWASGLAPWNRLIPRRNKAMSR